MVWFGPSSPPGATMTRIVVLDGYTANPGDLSWEALSALGTLVVHDRTAPADVVARAAGADVVLTNKTVLTAGTLVASGAPDAVRANPEVQTAYLGGH